MRAAVNGIGRRDEVCKNTRLATHHGRGREDEFIGFRAAASNHGRHRRWPALVVVTPACFALSHVLTVFADSSVLPEVLPRPLVAAVAGVLAVQILASALLRSVERGAVAATIMVIALLDLRLGVIAVAALAVALYMRFRIHRPLPTRPVAILALFLLIVSTTRAVTGGAIRLEGQEPDVAQQATGTPTAGNLPDIFVILLDGYPRSDTLATWSYDNGWFEDELIQRGFDVATESRTNYAITSLVVPSMLHMRHVAEIPALNPIPESSIGQIHALRRAVDRSPAMDRLEGLGYTTVSAGLPGWTVSLRTVDDYIDGGQMTTFEMQVVARTMLGTMPLTLQAQHRDRVLATFEAIGQTAHRDDRTFMLAHILSPHLPIVFDRHGELPEIPCAWPCRPFATYLADTGMASDDFYHAFTDQVHYLNGLVLDALDQIVEAKPEAVVILFSDHGARAGEGVSDEWFSTFFASRTLGRSGVFPNDARSIEIFPRLFNEYFGDAVPIPVDQSFHAPRAMLYPLFTEPTEP